ncbi:ornithine carbamoyltransferase [Desulfobotulus alkaliphilus]|uniref:Ornithine carbamoyltransferase n=1 Tax=Desulfobotulus alkaliphilus TaxID=622671 RepID=A0A562RZ32_9BACT|nr:ornithine carbamoyltransferase [Desulfobotulus alkaliphilus]TWI74407.1 ornithine carbamoyltransferase [Desulfobotulus alkaliphilus]
MKKDLLHLGELSREDFRMLMDRALAMKARRRLGIVDRPFAGKVMGMVFDKASTRTRVSFESAWARLGGHPMFLSTGATQMSRSEPVKDTARVLSRYIDVLVIRTYAQDLIEEFAKWSSIPVINALSDRFHPCQILSDLLTVVEMKGGFDKLNDLKFAWVGDGNNVAQSWINAAGVLGFSLMLACPEGYDPDGDVLALAEERSPGRVKVVRSPEEAMADADVVYTDVWASMGQEEEQKKREKDFKGFCVDEAGMKLAAKDALVLHCLPAHRGEEITDGVMESHPELWDQAENKMHMHAALLDCLVNK